MATSRLEEIRKVRIEKLEKLKKLGINPYPSKFSLEHIEIAKAMDMMDQEVVVAGRIWSWREHGNVIFADLKDESDKIQLLFQKTTLVDKYAVLKLIDVGDFLGVKGVVTKT